MAAENLTWGEERIADELWLKLQIRLSPRTVRKYIGKAPRPRGSDNQRWSTFIRNHANGIVACDFFVSVTLGFRILYTFVALEIGSRRLLHFNRAWPCRPPINNEKAHRICWAHNGVVGAQRLLT
jgi:putative transposase